VSSSTLHIPPNYVDGIRDLGRFHSKRKKSFVVNR